MEGREELNAGQSWGVGGGETGRFCPVLRQCLCPGADHSARPGPSGAERRLLELLCGL